MRIDVSDVMDVTMPDLIFDCVFNEKITDVGVEYMITIAGLLIYSIRIVTVIYRVVICVA